MSFFMQPPRMTAITNWKKGARLSCFNLINDCEFRAFRYVSLTVWGSNRLMGHILQLLSQRVPHRRRTFRSKRYETVTTRFYPDRIDDRGCDRRYSGGRRFAGLPGLCYPGQGI